jgi:hypothetical protein
MADLTVHTMTPSVIEGALLAASIAQIPTFVWGPPGVGKSSILQQIATRLGIAFIDVRLSQMDPTDVRGMPYKIEEDGQTIGVDWSPPLMFPKNLDKVGYRNLEAVETTISLGSLNPIGSNGIHYIRSPEYSVRSLTDGATAEIVEGSESATGVTVRLVDASGKTVGGRIMWSAKGQAQGIIAFEEMNSAPPSVLAACYQIILDRRVGNYVLPDGVSQFAMGNRETDKGVTFKMPTPLLNRFDHLELRENFDDWQNWAISARVHSDVVGFLSAFPAKMFQFAPGSASRGFPTPRSWVMVSSMLLALDEGRITLTDEQLRGMIYGAIGDAVGVEFFAHREIASVLPKPDEILNGIVTSLPPIEQTKKTGLSYSLTTSILYRLRELNERLLAEGIHERAESKDRMEWFAKVDRYILFAKDAFKPEVNIMTIRTALQGHALPINGQRCKEWKGFVAKYKQVLSDS